MQIWRLFFYSRYGIHSIYGSAKVAESPTNHLLITYYYLLGVSGVLLGKVLGPLEQVFFGKAGECFSGKRVGVFSGKRASAFRKSGRRERGDVFCFLLFFCYLLAYFGKKQ